MNKTLKTTLWVAVFAIAMGYLESAVVVYIRTLYYPEGFAFPMKVISNEIMFTEFFREAATMLMLLGIGFISGKTAIERFAYFIFSFAVWDIFYYVFLFVLLGWPQTLLAWDVLFFIPVTWVGPVLAPVINSLMMILLAALILFFSGRNKKVKINVWIWLLLVVGSLIVIVAYTMDYAGFMLKEFSLLKIMGIGNTEQVMAYATKYIPVKFNWWVFAAGALMHFTAIGLLIRENRSKKD
ncbi:MAG: hypothetical protein PHR81_01320 [Bacteroidales bacterium]|jgi:hypothetical protein|nr:hypothetical protein [Bacteroidales bacterium]MDD4213428.1 hypothetical protein [Bacteroidales bacterium]